MSIHSQTNDRGDVIIDMDSLEKAQKNAKNEQSTKRLKETQSIQTSNGRSRTFWIILKIASLAVIAFIGYKNYCLVQKVKQQLINQTQRNLKSEMMKSEIKQFEAQFGNYTNGRFVAKDFYGSIWQFNSREGNVTIKFVDQNNFDRDETTRILKLLKPKSKYVNVLGKQEGNANKFESYWWFRVKTEMRVEDVRRFEHQFGYKSGEPVGKGLFGSVWKFKSKAEKDVVIKFVNKEDYNDKELRHQRSAYEHGAGKYVVRVQKEPAEMFVSREGRIGFDFGLFMWFEMELMDGDLESLVSKKDAHGIYTDIPIRNALTEGDMKTLMRDLAIALDTIHTIGIVHRDVHCGNIMYNGSPGNYEFKLGDFGQSEKRKDDGDKRRYYDLMQKVVKGNWKKPPTTIENAIDRMDKEAKTMKGVLEILVEERILEKGWRMREEKRKSSQAFEAAEFGYTEFGYTNGEFIGKGWFGSVWKFKKGKEYVAIKFVNKDKYHEKGVENHQLAQKKIGQYVVRVQKGPAKQFGLLMWFEQELMDGDLRSLVSKKDDDDNYTIPIRNALSEEDMKTLMRDLAITLRELGSIGIAHRDVHWGNIMFKRSPGNYKFKLGDFGKSENRKDDVDLPDYLRLMRKVMAANWEIPPKTIENAINRMEDRERVKTMQDVLRILAEKDCMLCNASFSLFKRQYHCRACGGVFCKQCAPKPSSGERKCNTCNGLTPAEDPSTKSPLQTGVTASTSPTPTERERREKEEREKREKVERKRREKEERERMERERKKEEREEDARKKRMQREREEDKRKKRTAESGVSKPLPSIITAIVVVVVVFLMN